VETAGVSRRAGFRRPVPDQRPCRRPYPSARWPAGRAVRE